MSTKVNLILQPSTGPQGPQGTQGNQGGTGPQGSQGHQGFQGQASTVPGPQGSQGSTGSQGPQGFQGTTGPQGNQGSTGAQGATGSQGPQGHQGNQGPQGSTGAQGVQGATGSQGPQGVAGGAASFRGDWLTGTSYAVDDFVVETVGGVRTQYRCYSAHTAGGTTRPGIGASWEDRWELNIAGVVGPQGAQGPQGAVGAQGPQGFLGPQGAQGAQGVQGEVGTQGPQGVPGTGAQGPQGATGSQGPQGVRGFQGDTGPQGSSGAQGNQGAQGPQGADGTSASSVVNFTLGEDLTAGDLVRVVDDSGAKVKGLVETVGSNAISSLTTFNQTKTVKIATDKFVSVTVEGGTLTVIVHTVSGTTITSGTPTTITKSGSIFQFFITEQFTENSFLLVYTNYGNTVFHRTATVSGTTISLQTERSFTSGSDTVYISDVCYSGSVSTVVFRPGPFDAHLTRKIVGDTNAQAETNPGGGSYILTWQVEPWGDNAYYLVKLDDTTYQLMGIGSPVLVGSAVTTALTTTNTNAKIQNLGSNRVGLFHVNSNSELYLVLFTGTGITPTVSESYLVGSFADIFSEDQTADSGTPDGIVYLSDVFYEGDDKIGVVLVGADNSRPTSYLVNIKLENNVPVLSNVRNFQSIQTMSNGGNSNTRFYAYAFYHPLQNSLVYLNTRKFVLRGADRPTTSDTILGAGFRVVQYTDTIPFFDDAIGVLQETGSTSQSKPVSLLGSVSEAHSARTIGAIQYIANDGTITQTPTSRKIGRAIAADKILLTKNP